jgi:hypothetical protein
MMTPRDAARYDDGDDGEDDDVWPDTGGVDDAEDGELAHADEDAMISCPYCGAPNEIALDPSGGRSQDYVEDCQVCCQPWNVHVQYARDGTADVRVSAADEG